MVVEVLYFAEFKDLTKKEKESFTLKSYDLKELLSKLFEKYNSIRKLIWDDDSNKINDKISIIINTHAISEKNPSIISLNDGDKICFLFPVSGG